MPAASVAATAKRLIIDKIKSLNLTYLLVPDGAEGRQVQDLEITERTPPFAPDLKPHKGITISTLSEYESVDMREGRRMAGGTNSRDEIGHPFLITIATGTGKGNTEGAEFIDYTRERIRRAFNHQRLEGFDVTGVCDCGCTVQTHDLDLLDMGEWAQNWTVSQLKVTFWAREPRE